MEKGYREMWRCKFIVLLLMPMPIFSLAPEPGLQKKSGKGNHFIVNTVLLSEETTIEQKQDFIDMNAWNAKGTVHENGVVQLDYGSGVSSWSCAGPDAKTKLSQAGASRTRFKTTEEINGVSITHIQTRQFFPMIARFLRKFRIKKYVMTHPLLRTGVCDLDNAIINEILLGGEKRINRLMKDYKYKVFSNGGSIYLLLDDVIGNEISVLRFDGVIESTERHQRGPGRAVKMFTNGPSIFNVEQSKDGGWLDYGDAKREFEMSAIAGSDEPLALGRYSFGNRGFVVSGVKFDDLRFALSGHGLFYENRINGHSDKIDAKATLKEIGKLVRGFHTMGIIHGSLSISNVGLVDPEMDGSIIIRGWSKGFQLSIDASPQFRAGWAFVDLSYFLEAFSKLEQGGVDGAQFTSKLLEGYFNGYAPRHVIAECSSPMFATKMGWLNSGGLSIPDIFPMTYNYLLMTELNEWGLNLEETKDERSFTVDMQKADREKTNKDDDDDDMDIDGGSMPGDNTPSSLGRLIRRKFNFIKNLKKSS